MAKQSRIAHISDTELANMTAKEIGEKWYNGNTGAGYNACVARGIKPKAANGEQGVVTAKPIAAHAKPAPAEPVKKESSDPILCPGRVSDFFEDNVDGYVSGTEITPAMVEKVILDDSVKWNQRIMKFGPKEIEGLGEFLASGGYCPVARVSQRADWLAEQERLAVAKRIADSISAVLAIDNRLASQRERFEASRFDAAITAFYAA